MVAEPSSTQSDAEEAHAEDTHTVSPVESRPKLAVDLSSAMRLELLTGVRRLRGNCRLLEEKPRLSDFLNGHDEVLLLAPALVETLAGTGPQILPELSLDKHSLCLVVPGEEQRLKESEFLRQEALSLPTKLRALIVLPPFVAEGTLHLPLGSLRPNDASLQALLENRLGRSPLKRFFPLTDATLFGEDGSARQLPLIFVNRDAVTELRAGFGPSTPKPSLQDVFGGIG